MGSNGMGKGVLSDPDPPCLLAKGKGDIAVDPTEIALFFFCLVLFFFF